MGDELNFRQYAARLLTLLTELQKRAVHQSAMHLSMGETGVMRCLYLNRESMSAGELSRVLGISSGGVANLLNSLEKKGLISRVMNPTDRRGILVSLSDSGYHLLEARQNEAVRITSELLARLGQEDTEHLIRIYQKMLNIEDNYIKENCKKAKCPEDK